MLDERMKNLEQKLVREVEEYNRLQSLLRIQFAVVQSINGTIRKLIDDKEE